MTRAIWAVLAGLFLAGEGIAASSEREELLLRLFRENGCKMAEADFNRILPKYGFTKEETRAIEQKWIKKGWIDQSQLMTVSLTRKACKG